ncbi:MAG: hypothetical protein QM626_00210 [Microbacterium sp.]|uniref:PTS sugar transporter subunit IIB n=1 Tax=Microbacterium sp. TaxID=51671 RepID=UPI0039E41C33
MRILVVCGAGASSTFVAHRLRQAAHAAGLELEVAASARSAFADRLAGTDTVLIGPHLPDVDDVRTQSEAAGALAITLPEDVFADTDGTRILALVQPAPRGTP